MVEEELLPPTAGDGRQRLVKHGGRAAWPVKQRLVKQRLVKHGWPPTAGEGLQRLASGSSGATYTQQVLQSAL